MRNFGKKIRLESIVHLLIFLVIRYFVMRKMTKEKDWNL